MTRARDWLILGQLILVTAASGCSKAEETAAPAETPRALAAVTKRPYPGNWRKFVDDAAQDIDDDDLKGGIPKDSATKFIAYADALLAGAPTTTIRFPSELQGCENQTVDVTVETPKQNESLSFADFSSQPYLLARLTVSNWKCIKEVKPKEFRLAKLFRRSKGRPIFWMAMRGRSGRIHSYFVLGVGSPAMQAVVRTEFGFWPHNSLGEHTDSTLPPISSGAADVLEPTRLWKGLPAESDSPRVNIPPGEGAGLWVRCNMGCCTTGFWE